MRIFASRLGRSMAIATIPVLFAAVALVYSGKTVHAGAPYVSSQLISHDYAAYYHCTSGLNQNGAATNHCFYTPKQANYESNYWWCVGDGFFNDCPSPYYCEDSDHHYGGQIYESWYDYYHYWLKNTGDCVNAHGVHSNWYDVYGP
jgi:hypothetical protein